MGKWNETFDAEQPTSSDVNKDFTFKANDRTKDLTFKAKARTKNFLFILQESLRLGPRPRTNITYCLQDNANCVVHIPCSLLQTRRDD
jgi:hypothetical protein